MWDNKYMTIEELKEIVTTMRNGLDEDLRNLADEMEALDPASKDFGELDFEFNFINGQVSALSFVLNRIG